MKKKILFLSLTLITLSFLVILYGCGSNPTSNLEGSSGLGTISGIVKDITGSDISGVSITAGGKTISSDFSGAFDLGTVPAGSNLIVQFSRSGFVTTQQKVKLLAGGSAYLTQYIMPVGTSSDQIASSGGTVADGAGSVTIAPNSLVDASGNAVAGTYTVQFTSFDPTVTGEFNAFPGDFAGRTTATGTDTAFETFGYVNITILQGSNILNLQTGSTAEVHISIPTSLQSSSPSTIDLWSYNESGAYWIHEGIATKEVGNTYYVAVVSHFSYWNCDQPYSTGYISGKVIDQNGNPVAGAYIRETPVDWYGSAPYWNTFTGADGTFSNLPAKANSTTQIYAKKWQTYSTPETITGQPSVGDNYTLPDPLILNQLPETYWHVVGNAGFSAGVAYDTSMFVFEGTPYVAYRDTSLGSKAVAKKYNGVSWEAVGNSMGFSPGTASFITLYIDNGTPYVAFEDGANSNKASVMKYNGSTWGNVGNAGFSGSVLYNTGTVEVELTSAAYTSLYVYSGTPYVAFRDASNEATVMKYNSTLDTWEVVGFRGFSAGIVAYTSLYVYNGTPYVAFQDGSVVSKVTVMKYNGSAWENIGNAGFSAGIGAYTSLYVYNGTPYVAYVDNLNGSRVTVMKFNGSTWENVGIAGFSAGTAHDISLYIYKGTPYVAYTDNGNGGAATVMQYNGSTWENVGNAGFSDAGADMISLSFYNGTPYVAYRDQAYSYKTTVMKYGP